MRWGFGTHVYQNGDTYVGAWYQNKKHGYGLWSTADGYFREGVKNELRRFEDDKFIAIPRQEPEYIMNL
jgi:hypothetical protein